VLGGSGNSGAASHRGSSSQEGVPTRPFTLEVAGSGGGGCGGGGGGGGGGGTTQGAQEGRRVSTVARSKSESQQRPGSVQSSDRLPPELWHEGAAQG